MIRSSNLLFHLLVAHFASFATFDTSPGSSKSFKYKFSLIGWLDSIHCSPAFSLWDFHPLQENIIYVVPDCIYICEWVLKSQMSSAVQNKALMNLLPCPHLVVMRWPASQLHSPLVILSFSVSSWERKWIRGESVWQQWGLCSRSACRDLPNPSVTAAAHLVNYSYLGPGRDEGPWLLRIRKSREIVQADSGRAEMITHGLFTWTPVLFVLKLSLSWWVGLGANTWHFISFCRIPLQGCQIHDTAPRHEADVYVKVSSDSLCFNLWLCIFSGLRSGWEED